MSYQPTPIESDIAEYMREFLAEEDRMPYTREIQKRFGFLYQSQVMLRLNCLVGCGILESRGGWYRFVRQARPTRYDCDLDTVRTA